MTSAFLATGKTPSRAGYAIILALIGIGWGSTQPLGKIATTTGHGPFGLILWQLVVCVLVLGTLSLTRGKGLVVTRKAFEFYVAVAILGTLVPNATGYVVMGLLVLCSVLIAEKGKLFGPSDAEAGMGR